jgi:hypothetical protein
MNVASVRAVVLNEMRVRTRRLSSLVAMLAVIAIAWLLIPDPATGRSLIVVDKARLAYNSIALAIGSSSLASLLFGIGGFYLVRGRTREDLLHGMGGVLAATPVGSAGFLFARWLGAVAYLCALVLALMAGMLVLQAVRGETPLSPLVYLQTYALLLLPTLLLAASIAVLCDAWAPLMGKRGDVLYFAFWIGQFSIVPQMITKRSDQLGVLSIFDASGLATTIHRLRQQFHSDHFSIGGSRFDPTLTRIVLDDFWTAEMVVSRLACMLVMATPLLLAIALFHRFSPDRVKPMAHSRRRSLLTQLNRLLSPALRLVRPLFGLATRIPGRGGQVLADVALTLSANPAAIVAMVALFAAGLLSDAKALPGVLMAAIACWGIVVSDLAARDHQAATEAMTAAAPGGAGWRYLRQWLVTALLAYLCTAPVLLRWLGENPLRAAALVTGILALSAAASLLGRLTRTGRTFLGLFLFGLYLATQIKNAPWWDVVGFNGAANLQSIGAQTAFAVAAGVLGYLYNLREGKR